jgi:hypothetical protein
MSIGEDVPDLSVIIILVFTVVICAIITGTGQEYLREPSERQPPLRQQ